ncbi:MAG: galactokinase [Bryobacteraceae bacterium]
MHVVAVVPAQIVSAFQTAFDTPAVPAIYRAPGRVNLIGEHTDYNLGYVLPIALEMSCYAAVAANGRDDLRIFSQDFNKGFAIPVDSIENAERTGEWHDYVIGVARELARLEVPLSGADLFVQSEVPVGSGLSSSASLEMSSACALLGHRSLKPLELALLGQRAETQFVGVPTGIMDQYASVFGRQHAAIRIDCRSLEHEYVSLPSGVSVLAVNSMVKHQLGSSAYRERVNECRAAVEALRKTDPAVQSLRDATFDFFTRVQESVPPIPRQRARHVITENERVLEFAQAACIGDLEKMGRLFVASHRSMQYDYEISCGEIDFLVDTALKIPGVYGARMTGGGFGGCTVNLVQRGREDEFRSEIRELYHSKYGITPAFYDCEPANGAGIYSPAA